MKSLSLIIFLSFISVITAATTSGHNNRNVTLMTAKDFELKWGSYINSYDSIEDVDFFNKDVKLNSGILPWLTGLASAVQSITGAWQSITQAFASSYSNELTQTMTGRGFDQFKSSTRTFAGKGLPYEKGDEFLVDVANLIDMPSEYHKEFKFLFKWIMFFDESVWTQSDFTFNTGSGGSNKVLNFFLQNDQENDKMNIVFLKCDTSFELAPDLFVWVTRESKLGGMFQNTKTQIKKSPAAISDSQIQFVSEYFLFLAYQNIAKFMKIAIPGNNENPFANFEG